MSRKIFRNSGPPRHRGHPAGRRNVAGRLRVQIQRAVGRPVDLHARDGGDPDVRPVVVHVGVSTIVRGRVSRISDFDRGADEEVRRLLRSQEHPGRAGLRTRHLVLDIVVRAALADVGVLNGPVPQLPLSEDIDGVVIAPKALVCSHLPGVREAGRRAHEVRGSLACSGGETAGSVQAAREGRVPGDRALRSGRIYVLVGRIEPAASGGAEGNVVVRRVLPLLDPERQRERVDGRGLSGDVEVRLSLEVGDVHRAICQRQRIRPDVPGHRIFVGPVGDRIGVLDAELCRCRDVRQVVHGRHGVARRYGRLVRSERIGLILPRAGQHVRESADQGVLRRGAVCRCRPRVPRFPYPGGVRSIQDRLHCGIQRSSSCGCCAVRGDLLQHPEEFIFLAQVKYNFCFAHCPLLNQVSFVCT